jgi:putative transposase
MCRLLEVSTAGFYHWRERPVSWHTRRDLELTGLIQQIHERSYDGTYGAPRIHIELRESHGERVGRKRVARLMRRAGLKGVQKRRFRCTTHPGSPERFAPDLVQRHFTAEQPNALWLADVTYVPTEEGFLYLAAVLDVFSRTRCPPLDGQRRGLLRQRHDGIVFLESGGGSAGSLSLAHARGGSRQDLLVDRRVV